jgi:predicted nucleotidyltransferase
MRTIRLSAEQLQTIRQSIALTFPPGTLAYVFGSRANEDMKGGDIDLLIESEGDERSILAAELSLYALLQRALGMQKIDIVTHRRGTPLRHIHEEALRHGVPI